MKSWKTMIETEMSRFHDSWDNVESCTMTDEEANEEFNNGFGGICGREFTLWTRKRVYFPICYDGAEWCGSASRNPDGKPTEHQGGG